MAKMTDEDWNIIYECVKGYADAGDKDAERARKRLLAYLKEKP